MGCCKSKKNDDPLPEPVPPNIKGYYSWSWGGGSYGQDGANIGIDFNGYVNVAIALGTYPAAYPALTSPGRVGPWITLGGGNDHGNFTVEAIKDISDNLQSIIDKKYSGIIFDIEIANGEEEGLVSSF